MKNDDLEQLISSLDFDLSSPEEGHRHRFQKKLEAASGKKTKSSGVISLLISSMAIAATFLLAFLLFQGLFETKLNQGGELASVSPEMEETQNFFASVISKELYKLDQEKNPATESIIQDALSQLEILETDYNKLKADLLKSGQDKRVISAMISNFQKRIDLLNSVLEKVNTINNLKNSTHEDNLL